MLVGRDEVVESIVAACERPGLTVVVGLPGVGRTAALRAAAGRVDSRIVLAGFARLRNHRLLPLSFAVKRDLSHATGDEALAALASIAGARLFVDDLDEADEATIEVVVRLALDRPVVATWSSTGDLPETASSTITVPPLPLDSSVEVAAALGASDPYVVAREAGGRPAAIEALAGGHPLPSRIDTTPPPLSAPARADLALLALAEGAVDPSAMHELDTLVDLHLAATTDAGAVATFLPVARAVLEDADLPALHARASEGVRDPEASVRHLVASGAADRDVVERARTLATTVDDPLVAARLAAVVADRTGAGTDHLIAASYAVRGADASLAALHAEVALRTSGAGVEAALVAAQAKRLAGDDAGALRVLPDAAAPEVDAERVRLEVATRWTSKRATQGEAPSAVLARALLRRDGASAMAAAGAGRAANDRDVELTALATAAIAAVANGDSGEARSLAARVRERSVETGAPAWTSTSRAFVAATAFHVDGRTTDLLEIISDDEQAHGPLVVANAAVALAATGRSGEALALLDTIGDSDGSPVTATIVRWAATEVAAAAGRVTTARAAADRCIAGAPSGFVLAPLAVLAALRVAPPVETTTIELPTFDAPVPLTTAIETEHAALSLGHDDVGTRSAAFAAAAGAWEGVHKPTSLRCSWAAADAAIGIPARREHAVAELRALDAEATALDLRPLVASVRRTLRTAGERVATEAGARQGRLSAREREVLELVRQGRTSAEIAAHLGVARSTVETQIKSAMQKLGATSRVQAAAMAAER